MYAYLRLALMVVKNMFRKREVFDHTTSYVWTLRPGLADLDVYPEVNNGRHFVLFDLARTKGFVEIGGSGWRKQRSDSPLVNTYRSWCDARGVCAIFLHKVRISLFGVQALGRRVMTGGRARDVQACTARMRRV